TAPSPSSKSPGVNQEKLVRVYEINEEQYERVLQLTKGKNVISEARLINGGFATVSETLSSGWHSLLRIVGLTTVTKSDEEEKVDFDGQPLCVIKSREGDSLGRDEEVPSARSNGKGIDADDDDSAIHCIVVLKKDPELELPSQAAHQSFAPYWNHPEPVEEMSVVKQTQTVEPEKVVEEEPTEVTSTTVAPQKKKKVNKSVYPKENNSEVDIDVSRQYTYPSQAQYGYPYPPPPGGYGGAGAFNPASYGGSPYGYWPSSPYTSYPQQQTGYPLPQPGYPQQQPGYPQQQPGYPIGQPGIPSQPYYPSPYYGLNPLQPYSGGYPYNDKTKDDKNDDDDEEEDEEDSYEVDEGDYDYKKRYYPYKKAYVNYPYNY
ncbi:hypothetical protein KR018_000911, partial [Drosophila ironensis]